MGSSRISLLQRSEITSNNCLCCMSRKEQSVAIDDVMKHGMWKALTCLFSPRVTRRASCHSIRHPRYLSYCHLECYRHDGNTDFHRRSCFTTKMPVYLWTLECYFNWWLLQCSRFMHLSHSSVSRPGWSPALMYRRQTLAPHKLLDHFSNYV